ncbi:MAG: 50S ribosome-binding GTPase [Cyanobacterium sp. T60_A2020_053]|nr:50S ribosome-binding GTPase [Cyanobacterium sp. T60_A2020_053]
MLENIDLSQTFNIAILGRSNTGKSSLMNALLKLSRKEALQVSKVGIQPNLTKDFAIQKFFNDDIYLIDTPPIHDEYFENHKIINIINDMDLVILVIDGYPVYGHKYIFQKLSIYKSNVFVVLNGIDKWDNCFSDWINYTVSQWANYLNVDKIYLTCTRGYNPTEDSPKMDIRGVDLLRQDINNFVNQKIRQKHKNILMESAVKFKANENKDLLTSKDKKQIISTSELQSALKSCQQTAYISCEIALKYSNEINKILRNLIKSLDQEISISHQHKNKELKKSFDQVISAIKEILNKDIDELKSSLAKKKIHLSDYSIVLFGRTRAGKSTLREALTNGDGSTIGKGGQRTTRDVHEYQWNHLRLIDTPGIEAYNGEEDTHKATKKVDEADMVLFLTSDDSVQPGEFEEMARLTQINKPFIVLLNVKTKLETETQLNRFLTKPDRIFDQERLSGHHNHIQKCVSQHLNINQVQIIDIQARAGFLSNLPEYKNYKTKLWELSRLDQVYSIIAEDIYSNGNKRRASTFFDGTKVLINNIKQQLLIIKQDINSQITFLQKEEKELKKLFNDFIKDKDKKIDTDVRAIFSRFTQTIPAFIDETAGKKNAETKWKDKQKELEDKLKESIPTIFKTMEIELKEKLSEFEKEYSYDAKNINFNINFDKVNEGIFGNVLRGLGILLGAIGVAVFFSNPVIPAIGLGLTAIFNWISDKVKKDEKRKFNEEKEKRKNDLVAQLKKKEKELIIELQNEVKPKLKEIEKDILSPLEFSLKELSFINQQIFIAEQAIEKQLNELKNDHELMEQSFND